MRARPMACHSCGKSIEKQSPLCPSGLHLQNQAYDVKAAALLLGAIVALALAGSAVVAWYSGAAWH